MMRTLFLTSTILLLCHHAHAQYNAVAGQSAPMEDTVVEYTDELGARKQRVEKRAPTRDDFGNAQGNQFDLAVDGAFEGQTVAVLHFYTGEGFDFSLPKAALAQKGFSVYRWIGGPPEPVELKKGLEKASQLWLISGDRRLLSDEHVKIIKEFFEAGHGVYIWGDNDPYYADANAVATALLGTTMQGNLMGNQTVGLREKNSGGGVLPNHLLSTGLEHIYEGITIATIQPNQNLKPLIYGSANNLVTAFYDRGGKRAILDGGFTRLYMKWDTAGTARYVKNAAAWLVNVERFEELARAD